MLNSNWIPLAFLVISSGIEFGHGAGFFRYDRDRILEGEFWRLVTGHLAHGTRLHWLFNAAGLVLLWGIYPGYFRQPVSLLLSLCIALLVSTSLLVLNPNVSWYVGMSALLHGLFTAWSAMDLSAGRRLASFPLALVVMKVLYEQYSGASPWVSEAVGIPVLVDAHLYGTIAGLILAIIPYKHSVR